VWKQFFRKKVMPRVKRPLAKFRNHSGLIVFHIILPFFSFICLFFIGGIYLSLAGISGFFWLNMEIAQKNKLL